MSGRGEEAQHCGEEERPRPVRFSIFGQIQQQVQRGRESFVDQLHHHVSIKAESGQYVNQERYHHDDDDEEEELEREAGGDQPLDFSAKKPAITAKVAVGLSNGHHFTGQTWSHHLPGVVAAASHSSESGVSDLCSNSPQSDTAEPPVPAKSPIESSAASPIHQQSNVIQQSRVNQIPSPLPAALSAIYGPLAALQQQQQLQQQMQQQMQQQNGRNGMNGIDPAMSAATTQLLSNLAAVTNGGKGGKNTRPFKAYPRDPMSLPLGLYGLPMSAGNAGEETVMTQASNDAYAEFRRQMLSQVNATKGKRKSSLSGNGSSRPGSVTGDDEDMNNSDMHHVNDMDMPETTIRGTVSVTDLRLVNNEEDSEHSANDSIHAPASSAMARTTSQSPMALLPGAGGSGGSSSNGGSGSKKRARNGEEIKDDAYWERRRKNNEAAKRSRDARRAKEDEIAIRAAFLEQENLKLRFELANLKNETAKLRCMIYNS